MILFYIINLDYSRSDRLAYHYSLSSGLERFYESPTPDLHEGIHLSFATRLHYPLKPPFTKIYQ